MLERGSAGDASHPTAGVNDRHHAVQLRPREIVLQERAEVQQHQGKGQLAPQKQRPQPALVECLARQTGPHRHEQQQRPDEYSHKHSIGAVAPAARRYHPTESITPNAAIAWKRGRLSAPTRETNSASDKPSASASAANSARYSAKKGAAAQLASL